MDSEPPKAIREIVRRWRDDGSPTQPATRWPRQRWVTSFPADSEALRAVPDLLDRQSVRRSCAGAAAGADAARDAFLVVMASGYGSQVGYGPWRTRRILTHIPDAADRLLAVTRTLAEDDAPSAYRRLARGGDCTLFWLGPAFGTKYLYFCQPSGQETTALILDALVSAWIERETGLKLNSVSWSVPTYGTYLEHMHRWAPAVGCRPDELEYCIFRTMAKESQSQWGSGRST
jgi:hypothetical protein